MQILLFFLLITASSFAQIEAPILPVSFEQNPSGIRWKKIDTPHFELIFPEEVTSEAQRVAHLLERAYPFVTRSLEVQPPKIPLVLQNQSVDSNGFVTLAPRRSEWFLTPSLDPILTNTEWLKTLAIHEFRHVVQFQKTRQKFNRAYEILFGEIGQALGLALTLPPWFLEGDAVGIETALTEGGRGRLPLFERDLRAILLSGRDYDFDKAILRSYEDWVPNHYLYGYFLTSGMREKYGDLILSRLADEASVSSWNPLTFYNAADRFFEGSFEDFYRETMASLIGAWKEEARKLKLTPYEVRTAHRPYGWTNYQYPMVSDEGKIIALKSGLSFINQFVLLDGKTEEVLFYPGRLIQEWPYKLRAQRFAYLELELDPRWGYRDYATLKVFDVDKREEILSLGGTKLRHAVLDHQGKRILAIEWPSDQEQSVVLLSEEGALVKNIPIRKDWVITSIDWLGIDRAVLVIKNREDLKSLMELSLETGEIRSLTEWGHTNLGFVTVSQGEILVESPASGIDNIYHYKDGKLTQLTTAPFGAYSPVLHEGRLYYANYTVDGMDVVVKEGPWQESFPSEGSFVPVFKKFAQAEGLEGLAAKLAEGQEELRVEDYSQVRNSLNLHSWVVLAPPLSNSITLVGFSRDILNKFTLSAGGEYNVDEKTARGFVGAVWSHLWPVFDLRAAYGNRRQSVPVTNVRNKENKWEEGTLEAGIQVPWRSIIGRFNQSFTARAFGKLIHVTDRVTGDPTELVEGTLFSPGVEAQWSFLQRSTVRDLAPPLGFTLEGHFEEGREITGVDQRGSLLSADLKGFLPGLMRHHAFYHQLAYERQRDNLYQYSSLVADPRGASNVFLDELLKYSANYTLPLAYPDWHWHRYIYLKRLALNGFYDEMKGKYGSIPYQTSSAGWELLFETHFLRLLLPLTWGIRGSYLLSGPEQGESNYEFFLSSVLGVF